MSHAEAFAGSLSSAISSVLHVLEQLNALKALVDRALLEKKEGSIVFQSPCLYRSAKDAGGYLRTGASWAYPIMKKGAKGKPARIGTLWFWCRLAPPAANSRTANEPSGPFIAVEVTEGKPDENDYGIDQWDHPSTWEDSEYTIKLKGIDFELPPFAFGETRTERGALEWAGFAYKLGSLTDSSTVNRDLIQPAVALARLLVDSKAVA